MAPVLGSDPGDLSLRTSLPVVDNSKYDLAVVSAQLDIIWTLTPKIQTEYTVRPTIKLNKESEKNVISLPINVGSMIYNISDKFAVYQAFGLQSADLNYAMKDGTTHIESGMQIMPNQNFLAIVNMGQDRMHTSGKTFSLYAADETTYQIAVSLLY